MRNVRLIAKLRAAKTEIRSPKSKRSPKPEARNAPDWPTPGPYYSTTRRPAEQLRVSVFGFHSDFGFRPSDFLPNSAGLRFTFYVSRFLRPPAPASQSPP